MMNLEEFKLNKIYAVLDNYLERATKEKVPLLEALDYLIEVERIEKDDKSLVMKTNVAGFPFRKTLDDYDFNCQPTIE